MEEVSCWTWPLAEAGEMGPLLALLSESERARAASFPALPHRNAYVIAHAGMRTAIARHLDREPSSLVFALAPGGKPYLPEVPDCHFNLAHTGQFAVCAVGRCVLGVDIEQTLPQPDALAISRQVASPREFAAMRALSSERIEAAFYRFWVRKEALLKASGTGLLGEPTLRHVGIDPWPDDAWQDLGPADGSGERWLGADIPAPGQHVAALVVAGDPGHPPTRHDLSLVL